MSSLRDEVRREMRRRRRSLSGKERRDRESAIIRRIASSPLFRRSRHIAFYFANDGEVDLLPLLLVALERGKSCYLPILSPTFHNRLWFAPYHPGDPLQLNRFHIPEPCCKPIHFRSPRALDLVLAPLVAFDGRGNRLGMGGGFYDRTFSYLSDRRALLRPRLLGVAFAFQKVARLPTESWDIPLSGVVSDDELTDFSGRRVDGTTDSKRPAEAGLSSDVRDFIAPRAVFVAPTESPLG